MSKNHEIATHELLQRIDAAIDAAAANRFEVEFEWPECHRPRCNGRHGDPDRALGLLKHAVFESIQKEIQFRSVTRPDIEDPEDSPTEAAVYMLAVLLNTYNVRHAGTFVRAARLIVEAFPALVPVLSATETTAEEAT